MDEIKRKFDLIQLQKKYKSGTVKIENLTIKQLEELIVLYDTQIEKIRKSNEYKKQKLLEYRKKMKGK